MAQATPRDPHSEAAIQFLTTEHFTLQTARSATIVEGNGRLQLYMSALTGAIVALALAAQVSRVGSAFYGFAFVLLPGMYVLGLTTIGRLSQLWLEWFTVSQGMNRIRRYYVEVAPETEPYLVMPVFDDPWTTLAAGGIGSSRSWWQGMVTAQALVGLVNSLVAGVLSGLVAAKVTAGALIPGLFGSMGFLLSFVFLLLSGRRRFFDRLAAAQVRFPAPGQGT